MKLFNGFFIPIFTILGCVTSTIIIIEDAKACFTRVLTGKRVARRFVQRFLLCERVEDCELECGEEKSFVCEGFNYRWDPTSHGKGECELLDVPIQRLDIRREVYPDHEFDYYERDRNTARTHCREKPRHPDYAIKRLPNRPAPYLPPYNRRVGYGNHQTLHKYDKKSFQYDRRPPYYHEIDDYDNVPAIHHDRNRPLDYHLKRPYNGPHTDSRRGKYFQPNAVPDIICVHYNKK